MTRDLRWEAPPLYVVSGGAGAVGEQVARLVLSQFEGVNVPVIIAANVRDAHQIVMVIEEAAASGGTILHTLMEPDLRRDLVRRARERGVAEIDLVGSVLARLTTVLGREPIGAPGLYQQRRNAHFDRLEAIEYGMQHDDGARTSELDQAEIVLVGISRVGKTPLSMYMSVLGWKVANIPLVQGIELPPSLFKVDRRRVIGLIVDAEQITARRRWRQRRMGVSLGNRYVSPEDTAEEVEWAKRLYRKYGWTTLNVTDKSIEESADEIIAIVTRWFKHQS
jgi:[pyruvate, water dikinase]-phosphate phosphotransferase / [pyruvate, water dikinase] kinase